MTIRMPFGKHKGEELGNIPDDYLFWCLDHCTSMSPSLRKAIERHLNYEPLSQANGLLLDDDISTLVRTWYRDLAKRWHPDNGGSTDAMKAVNDAHDSLRKTLGIG